MPLKCHIGHSFSLKFSSCHHSFLALPSFIISSCWLRSFSLHHSMKVFFFLLKVDWIRTHMHSTYSAAASITDIWWWHVLRIATANCITVYPFIHFSVATTGACLTSFWTELMPQVHKLMTWFVFCFSCWGNIIHNIATPTSKIRSKNQAPFTSTIRAHTNVGTVCTSLYISS